MILYVVIWNQTCNISKVCLYSIYIYVCVKYLFFSRMILLKHITPLLRTFPDFSSHVEDILASLPQPADLTPLHSGPVAPWTSRPTPPLLLSAPAQASVLFLTCSRLPPQCLCPRCALCLEHSFPGTPALLLSLQHDEYSCPGRM